MKISTTLAVSLSVALLAGCASSAPEFGSSVRHMIRTQTYNPEAATGGQASAPAGQDGARAVTAIGQYRSDKEGRRTTQTPINISVSP